MTYQIAISGGGFRACASAAIMSKVLHEHGIWGAAERIMGISGGAWFLIALARGTLRHVPSLSVDDVIASLKDAGIIRQLSSDQRVLLKYEIIRGAAEVAESCSSSESTTAVGISSVAALEPGKTPAEVVAALSNVVSRALDDLIDCYGTGASVAVSRYPLESWAEFLRKHLLGCGGVMPFLSGDMTDYTGRAVSASTSLFAYAVTVNSARSFSWIELPVAADDDSQLSVTACVAPGTPPSSPVGAMVDSMLRAATQRRQASATLSPNDKTVTLSDDGSDLAADRIAAIVGSAFAFDCRFILKKLFNAGMWATEPLLPNVEGQVSIHRDDGVVDIFLRDAGLVVNVPYLRCTPTCGVLWVLDSSEGSTPETELRHAVDAGHIAPLELYTSVPVSAIGTLADDIKPFLCQGADPNTVVALFELADARPPHADTPCPRTIVVLMGLTDSATMEVPKVSTRERDLRRLSRRTGVIVSAILQYLRH